QPDAVPDAVDEVAAVPGVGDDGPGGRVDRLGGDTGPDRRTRALLRLLEHAVVLPHLPRRLADGVGAGGVGAVSRRHGAADVDDHRVAGLDDPVGQLVVRAGAVRPRTDDDEV